MNPFTTAEGLRLPARRFRGRLVAPVTIVTAGDEGDRVGLTVSSLLVAEGEPSLLYFLLGSATDLFYAVTETGRFVVHVCEERHREIADVFAGLRPSPGGMFSGRAVSDSEYGPVLEDLTTRAYCSYLRGEEDSYFVLAVATIDRVEPAALGDPLAHFRGSYRTLQ